MLTPLDHLLVALFAVAWPLFVTFVEMPAIRRREAAGLPPRRIFEYAHTVVIQWTFAGLALVVTVLAGRPLSELGLRMPAGLPLWVGAALVAAVVAGLLSQLGTVRRRPELRVALRRQLAPLNFLLPTNAVEIRVFYALALTAGICEELLFRGFLLRYLDQFTAMPVAVVVSSLVFGLAHAYQGRGGVVKAGVVGAAMAVLYLWTQSLLLPVIAHALIDVLGGRTAYEALREEPLMATAA